jgi:glycosyltransferase involved in cell wall biosynthesis
MHQSSLESMSRLASEAAHSVTEEPAGDAPFFSVVVPLYNVEPYVAEMIVSVQRQRMSDFEALLVDDGSTDRTVEIARQCIEGDDRFRLICLTKASGNPSTPRNVGIANSRGTYIALLDADDLWGPEKLQHDYEALQTIPVDILYSGAYYFRNSPSEAYHCIKPRKIGPAFYVKNPVSTLTMCIRRSMCRGQQVFDPDPLLGVEDYHFLLNAHHDGKIIASRPYVDAYHRTNSITSYYDTEDFGKVFRRHIYNVVKLGMTWSLSPSRLMLWIMCTAAFHFRRYVRDRALNLIWPAKS